MTKFYLAIFAAACIHVQAQQMEFRVLPGMGNMLVDVNSSGKALHNIGYYDYASNTSSPAEDNVRGTNRINNAGDIAGELAYDLEDGAIDQAGYRKNGVWKAIGFFPGTTPDEESFSTGYSISANSKFVTGQMSEGNTSFPYLFNTETETLTKLTDGSDQWLYGRGEGVNSQGIVAGFVDREDFYDTGTFWVPAYFDASGHLHYINLNENNAQEGEAVGINDAGQIVGYQGNKPFIYNISTGSFTAFDPPAGYDNAMFSSISENGVVIGFAGYYPEREAIIYHPSLGNVPVLLKDILATNGIDIAMEDGRLGTPMGISTDGNWVAGFNNVIGPPLFADGWILNFNDKLLSSNDCKLQGPANIVTAITNASQIGAVVNYSIQISCPNSSSANLNIERISGLPSGAEFPVGTTTVLHKLVDDQGNIVNVYAFNVIVNDLYCTMLPTGDFNGISKVKFSGIDNTTSLYPSSNGLYTNQIATVEQTKTYPFTLEANTWGTDNYVTVFIDWNQNGILDDSGERLNLGFLNSDGVDGVQLIKDITIPAGAKLGKTRMRVVLNDGEYIAGPCDNSNFVYGQMHDYTVDVKEFLAVKNTSIDNFQFYPNPVTDIVNFTSAKKIQTINLNSADGKLVKTIKVNASKSEINLSKLNSGVYVGTASFEDGSSKSFKVLKK